MNGVELRELFVGDEESAVAWRRIEHDAFAVVCAAVRNAPRRWYAGLIVVMSVHWIKEPRARPVNARVNWTRGRRTTGQMELI